MTVSQDGSDYSYYSTFAFGSSGKKLTLLFDSGSPRTWVFGGDCTSAACKAHNELTKADSTTLQVTDQPFNVNYGSGTVSGSYAKDTVSFAGFDKVPMTFGYALKASDDFVNYPIDGILGLGQPRAGIPPTVMQALTAQKLIKQNVFGLSISRAGDHGDGEITFGSWDTSKFKGDLNWLPSVTKESYWQIAFDSAGLDGNVDLFGSGRTAVIDSGTSSIFLPPADATTLCSKTKGCVSMGEESSVPCDTTINLVIKFASKSYTIPPKDWIGATIPGSKNMCTSNIIGRQVFGANDWLLGDIFLKNVYSVFDLEQSRVGFGSMDPSSQSTPSGSLVSATTPTAPPLSSPSSGSNSKGLGSTNTTSSVISKASTSSASGSLTGLNPAGASSTSANGGGSTVATSTSSGYSASATSPPVATSTKSSQSGTIKLVMSWRWVTSALILLWFGNL